MITSRRDFFRLMAAAGAAAAVSQVAPLVATEAVEVGEVRRVGDNVYVRAVPTRHVKAGQFVVWTDDGRVTPLTGYDWQVSRVGVVAPDITATHCWVQVYGQADVSVG